MRDITLEDTFRHQFTTRQFSDGVATTLAGTPVLSVLEENNATPITAGVSVSVDRASVVGLNEATIIATAANGYETGKTYSIYISTGTIGGTSAIGEVVGGFTIEKSSSFIRLGAPAGASVSADIADVPTVAEFNARTLVAASYFDPAADTVVNVTTVATLTGHTAQTADHTAGIADIPTVSEFNARTLVAASYFDPVTDTVALVTTTTNLTTNNDKTGYRLSATGVDDVWDETLAGHVTADTTGLLLNEWQDGGRLDLILDIIAADVINIDGIVPSAAGDAMTLTAAAVDLIWDELMAGHVTVDSSGEVMNDWQNGGRLDLILDARMAETSIATTGGAVDTVTTVTTTTTNTDMRGTDSAFLAASAPTNFSDLSITVTTGLVTLAGVTHTGAVIPTVTTLTGHTAQTGDSFAQIGVAGASLTDLGGMSTGMKAEVLVEVNAALDAAISELAQGAPSATPSVRTGIMLMYMALRNKLDVQTSGTDALEVHADDGTQIAIKLLSDDGSDYSEAKMTTGV